MSAQTDGGARGFRRLLRLSPRSTFGRVLLPAAAVAIVVVVAAVAATALVACGSAPSTGTVSGIVVQGPLLPVDPGSQVSWTTQKADVFVFKTGTTARLRTVHTGVDGRFSVALPPGRYRLSAQPSGISTMPIPHDVTLTVKAGETADARILLDSGVRFPANATARPAPAPAGGPWPYKQGLTGRTLVGPISPVMQTGQVNAKPQDAGLRILRPDGSVAATVQSTAAAGFAVALPTGTYIVEPLGGDKLFPRAAAPFSVTLAPGVWQSVQITYDSGIR